MTLRVPFGRVIPAAAVLAVVFFAGRSCAPGGPSEGVARTDTVTLTPAGYEGRLAALVIERDGLRARLEGVEAREPEVIVRVDTVVAPPDTVVRFVSVDSRGRLSYELLTRADSLAYRPEIRSRVDVGDCDEGYAIGADGSVACDVARFGHLAATATLSRQPQLGLAWRRTWRSPWEFGASTDGHTWDVYVRRSVNLW